MSRISVASMYSTSCTTQFEKRNRGEQSSLFQILKCHTKKSFQSQQTSGTFSGRPRCSRIGLIDQIMWLCRWFSTFFTHCVCVCLIYSTIRRLAGTYGKRCTWRARWAAADMWLAPFNWKKKERSRFLSLSCMWKRINWAQRRYPFFSWLLPEPLRE